MEINNKDRRDCILKTAINVVYSLIKYANSHNMKERDIMIYAMEQTVDD